MLEIILTLRRNMIDDLGRTRIMVRIDDDDEGYEDEGYEGEGHEDER